MACKTGRIKIFCINGLIWMKIVAIVYVSAGHGRFGN